MRLHSRFDNVCVCAGSGGGLTRGGLTNMAESNVSSGSSSATATTTRAVLESATKCGRVWIVVDICQPWLKCVAASATL